MPLELDGYRVGAVLGEGGSGTVYAGTVLDGARDVALKVLRADLALTDSEVKRFLAEAALMQRISHVSVVPVLGSGLVADGRPYLVMPRLEGETLAARLHRAPLTVGDALALFEQLADAVDTLHAAGIIHRDLKPENVFVVEGTRVVLLDFGIAKEASAPASTTTTEGRVRGTPAYMAPERFFNAPASVRSDIYELAVTLYEMLLGTLPWRNPDDVSARLDPDGREVPAPLWSVIRLALASNAQLRPASVREFRDALRSADNLPPTLRTATLKRKALSPGAETDAQLRLAVGSDGMQMAAGARVAVPADSEKLSVGAPAAPNTPRRSRTIPIAIGGAALAAAGVITFAFTRGDDPPSTSAAAAPAVTFCAGLTPRPMFCADFETDDFRQGFINEGKTPDPGELGGGTIRLAPARDGFGSRSAEIAIPPLVEATSKASAALIAPLPAKIRYASITLRLRIDTEHFADDKTVANIFSLNFGPAGAINISRRQSGMQLVIFDGNKAEKAPLSTPFPVGTWKTIKLLVHNYPTQPDGRGDVAVLIDGLAAKLPLPVGIQDLDVPRLNLGIVAARGPMEALRLHIDDVAITTYDGPDPGAR